MSAKSLKKERYFMKLKQLFSNAGKKKSLWISLGVIALLVIVSLYFFKNPFAKELSSDNEPFVEVSSLMVGKGTGLDVLYTDKINIGEYEAIYEYMDKGEPKLLKNSRGCALENEKGWYYVSGHTDKQYLIRETDGNYTLWKFMNFNSDEYPYSDVLELVYDIDRADMIKKITVSPPQMNGSRPGRAAMEKIGTYDITERSDIETMYNIISSMTCYGYNKWEMIDEGEFEEYDEYDENAQPYLEEIWLGRYLSFLTSYGNEIDGLKFTAVSDMFYEFGGVPYNRLNKEQADAVCEVLKIDREMKDTDIVWERPNKPSVESLNRNK